MQKKMTLQEFKDNLLCEGLHETRQTQVSVWRFNGLDVFYERAHFPHNVFKPISITHSSITIYTDLKLATQHAKNYVGEVCEDPYSEEDNRIYFLRFDDFDNATKFVFETNNNMLTL